jgi:hypothetical protein
MSNFNLTTGLVEQWNKERGQDRALLLLDVAKSKFGLVQEIAVSERAIVHFGQLTPEERTLWLHGKVNSRAVAELTLRVATGKTLEELRAEQDTPESRAAARQKMGL